MIWLYYSYGLVAFAILYVICWGAAIMYKDRKRARARRIEKIIDPYIDLRPTWELYSIRTTFDRKVN